MKTLRKMVAGLLLGGGLALGACGDFDITNENAPTQDNLSDNPSRAVLGRAARGIFGGLLASGVHTGFLTDVAGDMQQFGLYGRELYNLLGNDPRETGEELRGPQDPAGRAGGSWANKYAAIRSINAYLGAVEATSELTAEEKSAARGWALTMKANMFHRLTVRSGATGIPVDVDRLLTDDPAPFVSEQEAYEYVVGLLEEGATALNAGGGAFPFTFAPGWTGFNTPATFLRFNQALLAKVRVNQATLGGCGAPCFTAALTALGGSFIDPAGALDAGVYYAYDAAAGEPANPITENLTAERYYVHPSIEAMVQQRGDNSDDLRWTTKFRAGTAKSLNDLDGTIKPILYNTNTETSSTSNLSADIPALRNEELILIRAEANLGLGNTGAAIDDINTIRTRAGGLEPTTLTAGSPAGDILTELLYNRTMSLIFEGGVRWIDARKYDRLDALPRDRAGDVVHEHMLVPVAECDARGLTVPCLPLN